MPKDSTLQPHLRRWRRVLLSASLACALLVAFLAWRHTPVSTVPVKLSHTYQQALDQAHDGKPGAARMLYQQLARSDLQDEQRINLLAELHNYPSPQALKLLDAHLGNDSPAVRQAAIKATLDLLPRSHRSVLLGPLLSDPDASVRFDATLALTQLSPDELGLYFAAMQHSAEMFQQSLQQQMPTAENRLQLASLYEQTGRKIQALGALEEAVNLAPDNLDAALARLALMDETGHQEQARQSFARLLERHPDSPVLQHALGQWLLEHEQTEYALLSLAKASELAPENTAYRYDLAVALHALEQMEAAQQQLTHILQAQPAHRQARVLLIQYARESGQLQHVQVLLAELEQQNPDDPALQQGL